MVFAKMHFPSRRRCPLCGARLYYVGTLTNFFARLPKRVCLRRRAPASTHLLTLGLALTFLMVFPQCPTTAALAQSLGSRRAICQPVWDSCLTNTVGDHWLPIFAKCRIETSACLAGRTTGRPRNIRVPPQPHKQDIPTSSDTLASNDPKEADLSTRMTLCDDGRALGDRSSCTLAHYNEGYGQSFNLQGSNILMSSGARGASIIKCAGGAAASFYPNGRIQSCKLDRNGEFGISLVDETGRLIVCPNHSSAHFDPKGRVVSCS
jgi:hypothetical protein